MIKMTVTLPVDIFLALRSYLDVKTLLELACTSRALTDPLSKSAIRAALMVTKDPKPLTYSIVNGDISLLSLSIATLDSTYPHGWRPVDLFDEGSVRFHALAAAHNLESLKFLVQKYPLLPATALETIPDSDIPLLHRQFGHGLYSSIRAPIVPAIINLRNGFLVRAAILAGKFDCATFLLRDYTPALFPDGFKPNGDLLYFSSSINLEFLVSHNADLGVDALQNAIDAGDHADPRVLDILLQVGFKVDAPRHSVANYLIGPITTPLVMACERLQPSNVKNLLRAGAKPNGISDSYEITKVPMFGMFRYESPNPILVILLSERWFSLPTFPPIDPWEIGERFILCFQSLNRHGALIPPHFLEILLFKIWLLICRRMITKDGFVLPNCENHPKDQNLGVRSLLKALEGADITPFDRVCQVVSDSNPASFQMDLSGTVIDWKEKAQQINGKARLLKFLCEYQDHYNDLPGPAQVQRQSTWVIPDRYSAQ